MLSCEETRLALPGIEAGEHADGTVRDHLASCDACREAASELRTDLERLRAGLSALAPSPLVEDAVVDIARDQARGAKTGSWKPVLVTLAAAAVLFGVILLSQQGGEPPSGEPPEQATRDARPRLTLDLLADGRLFLDGHQEFALRTNGAWVSPGEIARITEAMAAAVAGAEHDASGNPDVVAVLTVEADTPWMMVQWVMQVCAHPRVRVTRHQFHRMGSDEAPLFNELPTDPGMAPDGSDPLMFTRSFKVKLFAYGNETKVKADDGTWFLGRGDDESVLAAIAELARRALAAAGPDASAEIVAPPPRGGRVRYEHVLHIMRILQDAGVQNVLFEGAAMPPR